MTAHWMAYAVAVGALLALAAWALEAALRSGGRPARGVWAAALVLSLALPAGARWIPRTAPPAAAVDQPADLPGSLVDPAALLDEGRAAAPRWNLSSTDRPLAVLWTGASAATLLALAAMAGALHLRRRRWSPAEVDGERVLVSDDVGPAVVGLLQGRIVLPRWVLDEADGRTRALLLEHEREHLRAGDPRLLALALLAIVALPFSPAAWWMLRRLRLAVEVDCDARVLARRADVAAYGRLLLEVGRRRSPALPLLAFSEPTSYLERRIRIMTTRRTRTPRLRAAGLATLGLALAAAACETPGPVNPTPISTEVYVIENAREGMQPSVLTPREAIERFYPEILTRGAGENAELVFVVGGDGEVVEHHLTRRPAAPADAAHGGRRALTMRRLEELRVRPESIERVDVASIRPGMMGPDAFSLVWIQQRPSGEPREALDTRAWVPSVAADPQEPSAAVLREHVARYLPEVAARGTSSEFVYFVVDAAGAVVAHGEGGPGQAEGLEGRDPATIESVRIFKGAQVRVNGHDVSVLWMRLKA